MTKKLTLLSFFLCILSISGYSQTVLQGKVSDSDGGVIGAAVLLFQNDVQVKAIPTDFDGNYIFTNIDPGSYDIQVSSLGLATQRINGVVISDNSTTKVDITMEVEGEMIDVVTIKDYRVPLIDFDQTSSVKTVTAESIANSPLKNVAAIAATSSGLSSDSDGNISIRGARSNATNYYVDGIRVTDVGLLPAAEIEQLQVITGGLGARYGDVTGGVISLTSKGPSEKFSGGFEAETSQFLDPYGFNFLNANISGPLVKKNDKSIIGFRFNAQYVSQLDDRPSAVGVYRMPAETIADLEANPTFLIDGVAFPRAELLNETDLPNPLATRPNEDRYDLDLNGKIDARLSENIDISISGIYGTERNRFTPGGGFGLLNWTRNPYEYGTNYRGNFRWRHKIGKQGLPEERAEEGSSTLLRNASYILQFGIENVQKLREDVIHEDNFFDYGLYGSQDVTSTAVAGFVNPEEWFGPGIIETPFGFADHTTFTQSFGQFNQAIDENGTLSPNPVLSQYQAINGQLVGTAVDVWGTRFFDNVGRVYNNYRKFDNTRYTVNFDAQLDILPSGSIDNRHNIQFGGMYELRTNRRWTINPRELWTMARDAANAHFVAGVDTTTFVGTEFMGQFPFDNFSFQEYGRLIENDEDKLFYQNIREQLGVSLNEFVNIDGANVIANGLSLDQFSAGELINWRDLRLDYYGYDHLGNKSDGGSFNDFFTKTVDGRRTFEVAPISPVYLSGYIQDKFSYENIILRVGVRADYFDANTRVLEDPYSLYAIETADEFSKRRDLSIPSSVDPEAKVYLTGSDKENDGIKAFRVGDEWFTPAGTATDPQLIFGNEPVNPSYKFSDAENNIQSRDFNPDNSFSDYVPSFKLTPRVSLSFPISEEAGFFAHYDQLVQRPSSNTEFTALDYFFFEDISRLNLDGGPANNPNLRPETTIDYEVGFQQKLTNSSAIKLSAYYKENRDLIQTRFLLNVPIVNDYLTYDNIDLGTVKGFTATYDLRRTGNIELSGSYTLQYAEGTGSTANSGLSSRNGEVRVLVPLSFDERHRIVGNVDYRYASGDKYNGPRISGLDIFANAGLNLQIGAISGRPYTRASTINTPFNSSGFTGDINGARLPWNFNIDARVDKNFRFKANKESKKGINLNVYLRVSNLLDTRNVVSVYRVTGSPDNDGYLATQFGQDAINSVESTGKDVQSFLAAYEWALLNPGFYSLPRRIRIGGLINF